MDAPVTWGPVRYDRLRSAALGVALGGLVALLGLLALVAAAGLGGGVAWEPVLLFGLLLLVGGPMSLLYLASGYGASSEEKRARIRAALTPRREAFSRVRPGWFLVGVAAAVGSFAVPEVGGFVLVLAAPLAFGLLFPFTESREHFVRVDPAAGTVSVYDGDPRGRRDAEAEAFPDPERERDLSGLVRVGRLSLGPVAVVTLAHRGSTWLSGPFVLLVPREAAADAVAALRAVAAANDPDRLSRTERAIVGALGLFFLAIPPAVALLSGGRGVWVIGVACVPIGGLCCLLAVRA